MSPTIRHLSRIYGFTVQVLIYSRGGKSATMYRVFIRKDWSPAKEQRLPAAAATATTVRKPVSSAAQGASAGATLRSETAAQGEAAAVRPTQEQARVSSAKTSTEATAPETSGTSTMVMETARDSLQVQPEGEMQYFWVIAITVACVASLMGSWVWARLLAPSV